MLSTTFNRAWVGLLAVAIPAFAVSPGRPGTLNFLEGKVSVNGQEVTSKSIGAADVPSGSILRTETGKAELLLTPGVFLRLGSDSEIRVVSSGLMDTRISVNRGVALLEANDVRKENRIQIATPGLNSTVKDEGLYRFDATRPSVAVFKGKAEVRQGDEKVDVKKGKEVVASDAPLEAQKFDIKEAKKSDELYQWSNLRSKYLAEASAATAQRVLMQPSIWAGSGWYWNPWLRTYSWLPSGSAFYSPFGYGFYSPWSYSRPMYMAPRYRMHPRMRGPMMRPRMGPRMSPRPSGPRRPAVNMGRVPL